MNAFDEMRQAVTEARCTIKAADDVAANMAWMLKGRLRHVWSTDTLCALKKELRDFDMVKREWKK